jgi:hypothetical protein
MNIRFVEWAIVDCVDLERDGEQLKAIFIMVMNSISVP